MDLFISAGEPSGDLHGEKLIRALLDKKADLQIGGCLGPRMRGLPVESLFRMEDLSVMGFSDVLFHLPKIFQQLIAFRNAILTLNPKAVLLIDYPGFHLRLEKSLRKKGFQGKLIHFISPTVWAWKKGRIGQMEQNLDLLLTIFPFEPKYFAHTKLKTMYVGHPLVEAIPPTTRPKSKILALFPGSRAKEIERNLGPQMKAALELQKEDPELKIVVASPQEKNYDLMKSAHMAIAKSGTVTLELALHKVPTVVTFAIRPIDCLIAQKILRIDLPFYCIVNILLEKRVFPELFGPHLTEKNLLDWSKKLWFDPEARGECFRACDEVRKSLGARPAARASAEAILSSLDF